MGLLWELCFKRFTGIVLFWNPANIKWWIEIKKRIPALQKAGFTALWLPPVSKAASWKSMGYDPYDYYDLGEFDQKGGMPTWFGSKAELLDLVQTAHAHGMQVYADLVLNHNSGGDAQEENPIDRKMRWTKFQPSKHTISPVIGNAFIPALTNSGTMTLSETCPTSATAIPMSICNLSSTRDGCSRQ